MAEIINDQLNLLKKSSIDARQTTLQTVSELSSYAYYSYAYDGLEVTVLNNGHPLKFAMNSNGASRIRKNSWTLCDTIVADTYQGLVDLAENIVTTLNVSSTNVSKAFEVGQKAIVLSDETRDGKWAEYIVTAVENGVPTWEYNHTDHNKFSIVANSADTTVELYYDGVKIGDAADLSGILSQWQYDQFISSGNVVTEEDKKYIELYYNDETLSPIRIDVTSLGGSESTEGTQGPQGAEGQQGPQGSQGAEGKQGADGAQGPQGVEGKQGNDGVQGPQGAEGTQGPQGEGVQGPQGIEGVQGAEGKQGPAGTYEAGDGISLENGVISVVSDDIKNAAISALTEVLIPEGAKESLDTLKEIGEWIQQHPDDAAAMNADIQTISGAVEDIKSTIDNLEVGDKNVIESVKVDGTPLDIVDKSVDIILSGYAKTVEVNSAITEALKPYALSSNTVAAISEALEPYATSAGTMAAIADAMRSSLPANNYSEAVTLATSDNVGRIINVANDEEVSGGTYSSGLYIVTGAGEISKLGTTSATGDVEGDVETLKGRVGTLESAMYWLTDEDLVIE